MTRRRGAAPVGAHGASTDGTIAGSNERLVVVVAHPDDESFGCGSLIALAVAAGARVTVICATRGEAGERLPDPVTDAWPLGLLRESELLQAAIVLGVDDVVLLDHVDSGFDGPAPVGALTSVPLGALADELALRLGGLEPDVVLTLDGSDGHRDHCHLRDAVGLAVGRLARRPRLVHSCLARSLMTQWMDVVRVAEPDRDYLSLAEVGRPDAELIALDTTTVLGVRERAIACHLSQRSPFDALPPELRHRFLTTDHIVEVPGASLDQSAWTASRETPRSLANDGVDHTCSSEA